MPSLLDRVRDGSVWCGLPPDARIFDQSAYSQRPGFVPCGTLVLCHVPSSEELRPGDPPRPRLAGDLAFVVVGQYTRDAHNGWLAIGVPGQTTSTVYSVASDWVVPLAELPAETPIRSVYRPTFAVGDLAIVGASINRSDVGVPVVVLGFECRENAGDPTLPPKVVITVLGKLAITDLRPHPGLSTSRGYIPYRLLAPANGFHGPVEVLGEAVDLHEDRRAFTFPGRGLGDWWVRVSFLDTVTPKVPAWVVLPLPADGKIPKRHLAPAAYPNLVLFGPGDAIGVSASVCPEVRVNYAIPAQRRRISFASFGQPKTRSEAEIESPDLVWSVQVGRESAIHQIWTPRPGDPGEGAPYRLANTYDDGRICWGNTAKPESPREAYTSFWESPASADLWSEARVHRCERHACDRRNAHEASGGSLPTHCPVMHRCEGHHRLHACPSRQERRPAPGCGERGCACCAGVCDCASFCECCRSECGCHQTCFCCSGACRCVCTCDLIRRWETHLASYRPGSGRERDEWRPLTIRGLTRITFAPCPEALLVSSDPDVLSKVPVELHQVDGALRLVAAALTRVGDGWSASVPREGGDPFTFELSDDDCRVVGASKHVETFAF